MNKRAAAFFVLCLVQLGAAAAGIARYERVLSEGRAVLLPVAPIDPADPFRGRYVALSFELEQATHRLKGPTPPYEGPAYAVLKLGDQNVATVAHVTASEPESGLWLEVERVWQESDAGTVRVSLPLNRYYMNEALAPAAETAYRDAVTSDERAHSYAQVRILNGKAAIEGVLLGGIPIEEAAKGTQR